MMTMETTILPTSVATMCGSQDNKGRLQIYGT